MSCEACALAQDDGNESYFFRWRNANIEVRGCRQHVGEVFAVLRAAVSVAPSSSAALCGDCGGRGGHFSNCRLSPT